MTIYDFGKIDIISSSDDGLRLIIADPGNLVDKDRNYAFSRKLNVYRWALEDSDFQSQNPTWQQTRIQVSTSIEPTETMKNISSISFEADGKTFEVPIDFKIVESAFGGIDEKMHLVDINYNYKNLSDKVIHLAKEFIKIDSFTPFGWTWSLTGESKNIDVSLMSPDEQISAAKASLQESIVENDDIQAVALAYDVLAIHPDQEEKSDAIAIDLEHRLGKPLTILVHYHVNNGEVETLEPYAMVKEAELFGAASAEGELDS